MNKLMFWFSWVFICFFALFHVEQAFCQEAAVGYQGTVLEIFGWGIAVFTAISAILNALSKLMLFISKKTESKKDDKWAGWLSTGSLWCGKIVGWLNSPSFKKPKSG
jgi:uncharacterized membrane protein YozB (DUF420 family)